MDFEIQSFFGTMFQTIFQRKSLSLWFSFSFHKSFQLTDVTGETGGGLLEVYK